MDILYMLESALAQGLIWSVLAIGLYITFKLLNIADLTVDGSICTGAVVGAVLMINGVHPILACMVAFIAGSLAGFITGALHVFFGIPVILSGILTQMMLWSINLAILGSANVSIPAIDNPIFSATNLLATIGISLAVVALWIITLHLFFNTELGYALITVGSNEDMARAQGINVNLNKILGLMISNGLVALCGALLAKYQGYADINMGRGAIIIGLAAIVIGQALFSRLPKKFYLQLIGVTLGSFIFYLINAAIVAAGLPNLLKLFTALIIAIILAIPYRKSKISKNKIRTNKNKEEATHVRN